MVEPVVTLRGEIDRSNAARLRRDLRAAAADGDVSPLVVDCAQLTFIDLAGIDALETVRSELQRRGREIRLENLSPFHARLLALYESMPGGSSDRASARRPPRPPMRLTTTATTVTR